MSFKAGTFYPVVAALGICFSYVCLAWLSYHFLAMRLNKHEDYIKTRKWSNICILFFGLGAISFFGPWINLFNVLKLGSVQLFKTIESLIVLWCILISNYYWFTGWYRRWISIKVCDWMWKREINPTEQAWFIKYDCIFNNRLFLTGIALCITTVSGSIAFFASVALFKSGANAPFFHYMWQFFAVSLVSPWLLFWNYTINRVDDIYHFRNEVRMQYLCVPMCFACKGLAMYMEAAHEHRSATMLSLFGEIFPCLWVTYCGTAWLHRKIERSKDALELGMGVVTSTNALMNSPRPVPTNDNDRQPTITRTHSVSVVRLDECLTDEFLFRGFAKHLVSSLASESLLYLVESMQYKAVMWRLYESIPASILEQNPSLVLPLDETSKIARIFPTHCNKNILDIKWLPKHPLFADYKSRINKNEWCAFVNEMIQYIDRKYINPDAALSVNISSKDRSDIISVISQSVTSVNIQSMDDSPLPFLKAINEFHLYTIFDDSFLSLYRMLSGDNLRRFKDTPEYHRVTKIRNAETEIMVVQSSPSPRVSAMNSR